MTYNLCPRHPNRQLSASGYCMDCGGYPTSKTRGKP